MSKSTVNLRDVYEIAERIEAKFDEKFNDHEKRIRANETFRNRALGITAAFSAFSSLIAAFVWDKIIGKG